MSHAVIESRQGYINEEFIHDLAMRKLDLTADELEQIVGRYSKGKRKGQLRGMLLWKKCVKGGWVKTGPYDQDAMQACGYVQRPGATWDYQLVDSWTLQVLPWPTELCVVRQARLNADYKAAHPELFSDIEAKIKQYQTVVADTDRVLGFETLDQSQGDIIRKIKTDAETQIAGLQVLLRS